ncbi:Protein CBG07834 [Caenorhabditis briggsae]|uniref:Protein CBG07834 n=1 Tax=Caenorhabditis briggsae TaxID=6238 RepID=A8X586_CAEBR|nr:Protein CBG07834 [Caenorhabditis briggsae]CAP27785.1 Protein CBG07834 [Caenorhabditis briggsae]
MSRGRVYKRRWIGRWENDVIWGRDDFLGSVAGYAISRRKMMSSSGKALASIKVEDLEEKSEVSCGTLDVVIMSFIAQNLHHDLIMIKWDPDETHMVVLTKKGVVFRESNEWNWKNFSNKFVDEETKVLQWIDSEKVAIGLKKGGVMLMNTSGEILVKVTTVQCDYLISFAQWSPDGSIVAVGGLTKGNQQNIAFFSSHGKKVTPVFEENEQRKEENEGNMLLPRN